MRELAENVHFATLAGVAEVGPQAGWQLLAEDCLTPLLDFERQRDSVLVPEGNYGTKHNVEQDCVRDKPLRLVLLIL